MLLDGDYIATLLATFLIEQLQAAGLTQHLSLGMPNCLSPSCLSLGMSKSPVDITLTTGWVNGSYPNSCQEHRLAMEPTSHAHAWVCVCLTTTRKRSQCDGLRVLPPRARCHGNL